MSFLRGSGIGSMLMNRFEDYLRSSKVYGARLATISARANRFFQERGFWHFIPAQGDLFPDYLAPEEIYLSMYGKILE